MSSVSVILCTFQGERYLPSQLASLRAQTRAPFEIIARDDASTDSTLAILEQEAQKPGASSFSVKRNPSRLGFAQNFAAAVAEAKGEILFFCDQDDVWEPTKIEAISRKFEVDPALALACSEASLMDQDGNSLPGRVLKGNGLSEREMKEWEASRGFPYLLRRNPVPGMTMAIRRSFVSDFLPVPEGWEHDYWALLLAAGQAKKIVIERRPLVRYRQHPKQAVGGSVSFSDRWKRAEGQSLQARLQESQKLEILCDRLGKTGAPREFISLAEGKRMHLARRSRFSHSRIARAVEIAGELIKGEYHRYSAGLSTALKDWLASS